MEKKFILVFLGGIVILIFLAIAFAVNHPQEKLSAPIIPPAPSGPLEPKDLSLILPIYNDRMLTLIETTLKPYIRNNDILYINSGGTSQLNMEWVNNTVNRLKQSFPNNTIVGSTSGLENVATMSEKISNQIGIINYNYEPNFQNISEFNWDFSSTLKNIDKAVKITKNKGKKTMISPTGRPLLQESLLQYNWDYGEIGRRVDFQIIQTQRYCAKSTETFQEAINKLITQYRGSGLNWAPQITVSETDTNGVSPQKGYDCTLIPVNAGPSSLSIWWSPSNPEYLEQYLQLIGR